MARIGAARAGCDVWILDGRSPELLAAAIGGENVERTLGEIQLTDIEPQDGGRENAFRAVAPG